MSNNGPPELSSMATLVTSLVTASQVSKLKLTHGPKDPELLKKVIQKVTAPTAQEDAGISAYEDRKMHALQRTKQCL